MGKNLVRLIEEVRMAKREFIKEVVEKTTFNILVRK